MLEILNPVGRTKSESVQPTRVVFSNSKIRLKVNLSAITVILLKYNFKLKASEELKISVLFGN